MISADVLSYDKDKILINNFLSEGYEGKLQDFGLSIVVEE